jgi:hypothetical protein
MAKDQRTNSDKVRDYLKQHPKAVRGDVAKELGVSPSLVSVVRSRMKKKEVKKKKTAQTGIGSYRPKQTRTSPIVSPQRLTPALNGDISVPALMAAKELIAVAGGPENAASALEAYLAICE